MSLNVDLRTISVTNPGESKGFLVKHARAIKPGREKLSLAHRRTEAVYAVLAELFENGQTSFRPGDVNTALRDRGAPLGTWEVRAEFSELERQNRIVCDPETGLWQLAENASLQDAG